MSVTSAVFQVQSILQKVIPPPYYIDIKRQHFMINTIYSQKAYKRFRNVQQFIIVFLVLPCAFGRLLWLLYLWKFYGLHEMEQVVFYGMVLCIILVYVPADYLQTTHHLVIIYIGNQTLNLFHNEIKRVDAKSISKLPLVKCSLKQLLVYTFSTGFAILGPASFAAPFALPFLPLQLLFGPNFFVKLCEAFIYGFAVTFGAFTVLFVHLFALIFLENINFYIKSFIPLPCYQCQFPKYFKRYRKCQILFNLAATTYTSFLTTLIFVGIILASCCACITIKMYGKINILFYLLFPSLTLICVADAVILNYLGGTPYQRSQQFKLWWSFQLRRKDDIRYLKACRATGFILGPYGPCTPVLGLRICDDYIHNTLTILLLGVL